MLTKVKIRGCGSLLALLPSFWLVLGGVVLGCDDKEPYKAAEAAAVAVVMSTAVSDSAFYEGYSSVSYSESEAFSPYLLADHQEAEKYNKKGKLKKKWRNIKCREQLICYGWLEYGERSCIFQDVCGNPKTPHFHQHGGGDYHNHKKGTFGDHHHPVQEASLERQKVREALASKSLMEVISPAVFGRTYSLSLESSARLLYGLELARRADLSGLYDLGFSDEDLKDLALLRLPSGESMQRIAWNLNHTPHLTQDMLARIIQEGREMFLTSETTFY